MATIEDVNSRTLLQQFHNLYKKQNETETNVKNLDTKIDQETINRQTADLSINTEIQTLKDQIDSLGVLFTYKGEVATIQDLPATNNKPGDVYYVDSEQSEYVWLEKSNVYQWEEFGPAIDLSEYAKQEDLQQLENAVNAMNTKVENNTSNITSLTNTKQDKLTAGTNISIDENNVISASGGNNNAVLLDTTPQYFDGDKTLYYDASKALYIKQKNGDPNGFTRIGPGYILLQKELGNYIQIICSSVNNGVLFKRKNNKELNLIVPNVDGWRTMAFIEDINAKVPDAPDTNGTYTLKCVVSNGVKTYQWVLDA